MGMRSQDERLQRSSLGTWCQTRRCEVLPPIRNSFSYHYHHECQKLDALLQSQTFCVCSDRDQRTSPDDPEQVQTYSSNPLESALIVYIRPDQPQSKRAKERKRLTSVTQKQILTMISYMNSSMSDSFKKDANFSTKTSTTSRDPLK